MSTRVGRRHRTASTKFQPAELLLVALATAASARPAAVNATHVARIGIGAVVTHVGAAPSTTPAQQQPLAPLPDDDHLPERERGGGKADGRLGEAALGNAEWWC